MDYIRKVPSQKGEERNGNNLAHSKRDPVSHPHQLKP